VDFVFHGTSPCCWGVLLDVREDSVIYIRDESTLVFLCFFVSAWKILLVFLHNLAFVVYYLYGKQVHSCKDMCLQHQLSHCVVCKVSQESFV